MGQEANATSTLRLSEEAQQELLRQHLDQQAPSLLVYHRNGVRVVPLSGDRAVVVGREPPADFVIDDPSLSRRHARFSLVQGVVMVEDLDSTNGTRLRGGRITVGRLAPGDELVLGSVLVALRGQREGHGLTNHDTFLAALDVELVRARHFGRCFIVVLVQARRSATADRDHYGRWADDVRAAVRPVDTIAIYSATALEVLMPEATVEEARDASHAMLRNADMALVAGVAAYPSNGTTADQILEACRRAALRATARGPVVCAAQESSRVAEALPDGGTGPIFSSAAMRKLFDTVDRAARSAIPVLLQGETGTGKEVVARALVERGPRRAKPLVCVNCGAIPTQLVESTLFGHEKGAFTGASQDNPGVFLSAAGGTVLLDEIGELPAAAQAALLRVLEAKLVTRVGSSREIQVDVRVIAATHCDLEAMAKEGRFRRDLLYRLNAITLEIPPLRERTEEIPALVHRFLRDAQADSGSTIAGVQTEAIERLCRYDWPGNLRELRNAIERAVVIAQGDTIAVEDLPERVRAASTASPAPRPSSPPADAAATLPGADDELEFAERMKRYEIDLIVAALHASGGNKTEAARRLRMPLRTLVHKVKSYGIRRPSYAAQEQER